MNDLVNTDPFLVFFGSFFLVMGLSVFFAKKPWQDFMTLFAENDAVALILGIITLPISLFIIVFYHNWDAPASMLLMVIGVLGILKALAMLLKPEMVQGLVKSGFVPPSWLQGLGAMIIGVALLTL